MNDKAKNIIALVRWTLTLAIVYGAYTETGLYTAYSFVLVIISIETHSMLVGKILKSMESLK